MERIGSQGLVAHFQPRASAAAIIVKVHYLLQGAKDAIVHIGSRACSIPDGRRLKSMSQECFGVDRKSSQIPINRFIVRGAGNADYFRFHPDIPGRQHAVEQGHIMAGPAPGLAHEQIEAPDLLHVQCGRITPHIIVETAVEHDEAAHISAQGIHDFECIDGGSSLYRECIGKQFAIGGILP